MLRQFAATEECPPTRRASSSGRGDAAPRVSKRHVPRQSGLRATQRPYRPPIWWFHRAALCPGADPRPPVRSPSLTPALRNLVKPSGFSVSADPRPSKIGRCEGNSYGEVRILFRSDGNGGRCEYEERTRRQGANLAEMARLRLPVPAGFTITTDFCTVYLQEGKQFPESLQAT